jgi:hypothetical protein
MRIIAAISSGLFVITLNLIASPSASGGNTKGCETDTPPIIDSFATYERVGDLGADGHVWALDAATETFRVWRMGTNAYCVKRHDVGTFTTFAGVSPEGTGSVSAGKTGTFEGTIYFKVRGFIDSTVPTTGSLGDFDAQCQRDGTCAGAEPHLLDLYFPRITAFGFLAFSASYVGEQGCGAWLQTTAGDVGDIVC